MNYRRFLVGTLTGIALLTLLLMIQHFGSEKIGDYAAGFIFLIGVILYLLLNRSKKG